MRRPIARAAIVAAVFAISVAYALPVAGHGVCAPLTKASLRAGIEDAAVIVVGTVGEGPSDGTVVVVPERYFKGTAESRSFLLQQPTDAGACGNAAIDAGTRLLLVLESRDNQLVWPDPSRVFVLHDGNATNAADAEWRNTEAEIEQEIQELTGQDSLPVEAGDDGQQIDWVGTVLPVTIALLVVFAIGLAMMRVWHRIDPS